MQRSFGSSLRTIPWLLLGLGIATLAHAEDTPTWALSGYGTLGVVHSNERNADYTSSVLKYSGAGATDRWSHDVDSRLGAQLDVTFDKRWSAVLQVVTEQNLENNYRPRVEWANVKYQVTPELALRVGRIALPVFLSADYRKIGYAYPWVRPPVESYGTMPITSSDGIDATWRWSVGPVRNATQVLFGHDDLDAVRPVKGRADHIVGLSHTSDWGALTVHADVFGSDLTLDIGNLLFQGFGAFGPAGQEVAANYAVDHKHVTVANIGVNYDPGNWFVMAEAGRTHTGSLLGDSRSMYVSGGLRQGAFTPYATYAKVRATGATVAKGFPVESLPAAYQPAAAALNAGLNTILSTIPQQSTVSAGVRWDVHANAALKLQLDRVTPRGGSRGTLINTTPAYRPDHAIQVVSVTFDFVY